MSPTHSEFSLQLLATAAFGEAADGDRPHLAVLTPLAVPVLDRLGQPQEMGDGAWEHHLRRAGRGLTSEVAAAYERACDRAVKAVQRWRLRHLIDAIRAECPDEAKANANAYALEWAGKRAREAARGWPLHQCQRLEDAALELLHRGYARFDPSDWTGGRPLAKWARAQLRQRLIDQFRHGRWETALDGSQADDDAANWSADELCECFRVLRDAVDAANFFPARPNGPDCYAVLVFELRIRLVERFGRAGVAEAFDTAAHWLPWPAWVGPRRFLPELPRLTDLWNKACELGCLPGEGGRPAFVGRCVHAVAPDLPWTPGRWSQWVHRGTEQIRECVRPDVWNIALATLFPQNNTLEGQK